MFTHNPRTTVDADKSVQLAPQIDPRDIARVRGGSTPEALTIIDPYAAPTRLRRLTDGFEVL